MRDLRRKIVAIANHSIDCLLWVPELVIVNLYNSFGDHFVVVRAPKGWILEYNERHLPSAMNENRHGNLVIRINRPRFKISNARYLLRPQTRWEKCSDTIYDWLNTTTGKIVLAVIYGYVFWNALF
jgi:hypothetical protein